MSRLLLQGFQAFFKAAAGWVAFYKADPYMESKTAHWTLFNSQVPFTRRFAGKFARRKSVGSPYPFSYFRRAIKNKGTNVDICIFCRQSTMPSDHKVPKDMHGRSERAWEQPHMRPSLCGHSSVAMTFTHHWQRSTDDIKMRSRPFSQFGNVNVERLFFHQENGWKAKDRDEK